MDILFSRSSIVSLCICKPKRHNPPGTITKTSKSGFRNLKTISHMIKHVSPIKDIHPHHLASLFVLLISNFSSSSVIFLILIFPFVVLVYLKDTYFQVEVKVYTEIGSPQDCFIK